MDADGEDNPRQVNRMLKEAINNQSLVITSNRKKRKEALIIVFLYKVHLLITFLFTMKWISFGNFSTEQKIPILIKYDNPSSNTTKALLNPHDFSDSVKAPTSRDNFMIANMYKKLPMKILTLLVPMIIILAIIIRQTSANVSRDR